MIVHNKSSGFNELADKVTCPRCKGFGATVTDAKNDTLCICRGKGELWQSKTGSGWCRAIGVRLEKSFLY